MTYSTITLLTFFIIHLASSEGEKLFTYQCSIGTCDTYGEKIEGTSQDVAKACSNDHPKCKAYEYVSRFDYGKLCDDKDNWGDSQKYQICVKFEDKSTVGKCRDTNYERTNKYGENCNAYNEGTKCGTGDDDDFRSSEMCCACGGGKTDNCINTHGNNTDNKGRGCDLYTADLCGYHDNENFISNNVCCKCRGGKFACNSTMNCFDSELCIDGLCIEEFAKMAKSVCSGKVIEAYSSFPAAREGCKNNDICNGIFDAGCDDENFLTCQGKIKSHVDRINKDFIESSCAWDRAFVERIDDVLDSNTSNDHTSSIKEQDEAFVEEDQTGYFLIMTWKNLLLLLIALVLFAFPLLLWQLKPKVFRTKENLMDCMQNAFVVICIMLACYMTIKETLRYIRNDDMSTISYKNFASSPKDTYPTFSICFTDDAEDEFSPIYDGLMYWWFSEEIPLILPIRMPHELYQIMIGGTAFDKSQPNPWTEEVDIRNISESYAETLSIKFEKLYDHFKFVADNPNDSLTWSIDNKDTRRLPYFVNYQDPNTVCFTRIEDEGANIIRIEDELNLLKENLRKLDLHVTIKVFVHHPGQLLRVFNSPIVQLELSDLRKLLSVNSKFIIKISQVSILRKRPNSNTPCNPDLKDDDVQFRIQVSKEVGCIPVYWKKLRSENLKFDTCETPEDMKKVWKMLQNFTHIQSTYLPPCNEMKFAVTYYSYYAHESLAFNFKYMEKNYQEIINEREFGPESLWSTIGGFVGIFVGTSLSQVPSLIASFYSWMQNMMK